MAGCRDVARTYRQRTWHFRSSSPTRLSLGFRTNKMMCFQYFGLKRMVEVALVPIAWVLGSHYSAKYIMFSINVNIFQTFASKCSPPCQHVFHQMWCTKLGSRLRGSEIHVPISRRGAFSDCVTLCYFLHTILYIYLYLHALQELQISLCIDTACVIS